MWVNEDVNGWAPCGNMGADHYNMNTPDDSTGKITGHQLSEQDYDVYCSVGTTERQMLAGSWRLLLCIRNFGISDREFQFISSTVCWQKRQGEASPSSNTYGHYEIDLGVAVWDNTAMAGLQTNSALGNSDNTKRTPAGGLPLATAESWRKPLTEGYRPTA